MWFRMSFNLLHSGVFSEILMSNGRGDRPECRMFVLTQMLCASAEGDCFESPEQVSKRFCVPVGSVRQVWACCLKHAALVETDKGYSMSQWMQRQGLIGNIRNCRESKKVASSKGLSDAKQNEERKANTISPANAAKLARLTKDV